MRQLRTILPILLAACALAGGGCATQSYAERMDQSVTLFRSGQYDRAATAAKAVADRADSPANHASSRLPRDGLVTRLELGTILRAAGRLDESTRAFERANQILAVIDESPQVRLTEEGAAALTNATATTYRGTQYDRVLVSVYLALNHLELGNFETARAYLRQAQERQRWAEDRFARQIAEQDKEARDLVERRGGNVDRLMADGSFRSQLAAADAPPPLDLRMYQNFRNPFAEFLTGVVFLSTGVGPGDRETAFGGFRQARGLEPDNPYLALLEDVADGGGVSGGESVLVHVIYEAGMGPSRGEHAFAFPAVLLSDAFYNVGTPAIALPAFKWGTPASSGVVARAGGETHRTARLLDVDGLVRAEWDVEWPRIVTRAVAATVTKAVAAAAVNAAARETDNPYIQIGTWIGASIAQVATTSADTRAWMTLPREVQIASFEAPADGRVTLDVGGYSATFDLDPRAAGHLLLVRQPAPGTPPAMRGVALRPGFDTAMSAGGNFTPNGASPSGPDNDLAAGRR